MTAADLSRLTILALAVVLGLIGGWVLAGSRDVPSRVRGVHRATGVLFLTLSAGALNRSRPGVGGEDWTVIALRTAAVVVGSCVLWMHVKRRRRGTRG